MPDSHKNFSYSTVATAPSPADTGTSLVVQAGGGALFPTVPFNATVWPAGIQPLASNAEIVRVTNITTDTFTITRQQESSSARSILVGDQIAATITKMTLTDAEAGDNHSQYAKLAGRAGGQQITGGTGAAEKLTLLSTTDALKSGIWLPSDWHEYADIASPWLAPGAGHTQLYGKGGAINARMNMAGFSVEVVLGGPTGMLLAKGQLGGLTPSSTTWNAGGWGLLAELTQLTSAPVTGMDSNGRRLRSTTTAAIGATAGFYTTGTIAERDAVPWIFDKIKLVQTTGCRYFLGFSNQTLATMLAADDPAGEYIGLSYSTARGDTNWQIIRKNGTTQTITNTGVAVSTDPRYFRLLNPQNTAWIVQLLSASLATLYSGLVTTAQGPAAATPLTFMAGIDARAAAAVSCDFLHGWLMFSV